MLVGKAGLAALGVVSGGRKGRRRDERLRGRHYAGTSIIIMAL